MEFIKNVIKIIVFSFKLIGQIFRFINDGLLKVNEELENYNESQRIPSSLLRLTLDATKTSLDHSWIKKNGIIADCDNYNEFIKLFLIYIQKYIDVLDYCIKNKTSHEAAMAYFYGNNHRGDYKSYSAIAVFNKRLKKKFVNFKMSLLDIEKFSKWEIALNDFYLKNKSILDADFNDSIVKVRLDISGINNLIEKINASDVYARIQIIETN